MAKVVRIPAESLHVSKPTWWLESRFHFNFADYYDPRKENFGVLRVLNDDLVKGKAGFGTHPHRNAEIFSYVVDGKLTHKDSMGYKESLPRGCVQYLSAGTGITHSEMNDQDETVRFLQVWITPDARGHKPQYGSSTYQQADRHNKLLHILGGTGFVPAWTDINQGECIKLHQDANVFVSEMDPGHAFDVHLGAQRQAYVACIEGSMQVNGLQLNMRDGCQIVGDNSSSAPLSIVAGDAGAHFMLVEMAKPVGFGQ